MTKEKETLKKINNLENKFNNLENKIIDLENNIEDKFNDLKNLINNFGQQNLLLEKEIKDLKQGQLNKGQSSKEHLNQEINEDDLYYFYIVSDSLKLDYFKIGITNNIKSRLSSIQTGNPNKVYLIDFLVGNKENIIQLEKTLKDKMSDYNVNGEWFQLEDEARMKLFNWLNEVKLNKHQLNNILDLDVKKQENSINKLSELKIDEVIELLKNYLKNINEELMFKNNLTNNFSMDYNYLFEILERENIVKNDLNKKDFKQLFYKLNNEYLCCFENIKKEEKVEKIEYTSEIKLLLDKIGIESLDGLINMPFENIYNFYVKECYGKLSKSELVSEFEMFGYTLGRLNKRSRSQNNNKNVTCSKALLSNDNDKNNNIFKKLTEKIIVNNINYGETSETLRKYAPQDLIKVI